MNWTYITGFFDADGSVTLCATNKGKGKTLKVSFHNNEVSILKEIQTYIYDELNIKGSLVLKRARKSTHQDSYDLTYSYNKALQVANKLQSLHPKKAHRIKVYNEIQLIIPRNGKYTEETLTKRQLLEEEFFKH